MMSRVFVLFAAAVLACEPARAQDYNFTHDIVGARTDPTSRDSPYINDATTALDRATDRAMREKVPVKHVQPEHRVILHRDNGSVTTTDVYLIPEPPATDEIYR